ncbi:MAG: 6-hydroxymethylpterin diphosphokinase MptE-like protein [Candidatus Bathyarchaeia archaeon]
MKLEDWWPWYEKIAKIFYLNPAEDQRAADLLSSIIGKRAAHLEDLRRKVEGRPVIIFGAGPSLEENLGEALKVIDRFEWCIVSADGATTALMKANLTPELIVTDLDGRIKDILEAQKAGALTVIHAHGDNIEALKGYLPVFHGEMVGTTQVQPRLGVYNFGGFTDGDRCAFLAEALDAVLIVLAGMDLGSVVGKYSKPHLEADSPAWEAKRKKHQIAKELLSWLSKHSRMKILNATGCGEKIWGVPNIRFENLARWRNLTVS